MGKDADCCDTCREFGHSSQAAPPVAEQPLDGGRVTLLVRSRGVERTIEIACGELTIGRAKTNTIPIDDFALSRQQCILRVTPTSVSVEDTRSACGTYLDGKHTHGPTEVGPGGVISMGSTRIHVLRR